MLRFRPWLNVLLALVLVVAPLAQAEPASALVGDMPAAASHGGCHDDGGDTLAMPKAIDPIGDCCDPGRCDCPCLHPLPVLLVAAPDMVTLPGGRAPGPGTSSRQAGNLRVPELRPPIA